MAQLTLFIICDKIVFLGVIWYQAPVFGTEKACAHRLHFSSQKSEAV